MNKLVERIKQTLFIDAALEEALVANFELQEFDKKSLLLKENQYCNQLYFIETGIIRTFHYQDGKDVTSWIYGENQFVTAWYGFLLQVQSFEYIEVLEPSTVRSITYTQLQTLYKEHPTFERYGRLLMEEQLAFLDYFYKGYFFLSAKERYQMLLKSYPDIELKVKLGHIASLLGISQETLSRIRAK